MNTFKAFLKIVWMNKVAILIYTVIFLALSIVSTNQGRHASTKTVFEKVNYPVTVFDEDQSTISKGLCDYIDQFAAVKVVEDNKDDLQDGLYNKEIVAVIRIEKGMGEQAANYQDISKTKMQSIPGTQYGTYIESQIANYMTTLYMNLKAGMTEEEAIKETAEVLKIKADVVYVSKEEVDKKQAIFFVYVPYLITSVIMVGLGPCIIAFNRKEVKKRIDASPNKPYKKNLGIVLGMIVTSLAFCILFMLMGVVMNGPDMISMRGLLYFTNILCYGLFALAATFMAGILTSTANALNMISNVLGVGMSFLGGVFVPVEIFSDGMLQLAKCLPTYWYVKATSVIVQTDFCTEDMQYIFNCFGIQILFAIALFTIVLVMTKLRKTSK